MDMGVSLIILVAIHDIPLYKFGSCPNNTHGVWCTKELQSLKGSTRILPIYTEDVYESVVKKLKAIDKQVRRGVHHGIQVVQELEKDREIESKMIEARSFHLLPGSNRCAYKGKDALALDERVSLHVPGEG